MNDKPFKGDVISVINVDDGVITAAGIGMIDDTFHGLIPGVVSGDSIAILVHVSSRATQDQRLINQDCLRIISRRHSDGVVTKCSNNGILDGVVSIPGPRIINQECLRISPRRHIDGVIWLGSSNSILDAAPDGVE
ncbi:hypothetical protein ES703_82485 [subsurface metagenome]